MGNCVCVVTNTAADNKKVVRQIKTPLSSSSLFSQDTVIIDEHEWSLIKKAYLNCKQGDQYLKNGDLDAALHSYKQMLHIPPKLHNSEIAALYIRQIAMGSTAKVYMRQSNYEDATRLYELALDISIEIEDKKGEAIILLQLATINKHTKNYRKAVKQGRQAVQIFREMGDRTINEATALLNLGSTLRALGNQKSSKECYALARAIFRENGSDGGRNSSDQEISIQNDIHLSI